MTLIFVSGSGIGAEEILSLEEEFVMAATSLEMPFRFHAEDSVPIDRFSESLDCIRQNVRSDLLPFYTKELATIFSKTELIEMLTFLRSAAWKKGLALTEFQLMPAFGKRAGDTLNPPPLSTDEEREIKNYASSTLGAKFFSYVMSLALISHSERDVQKSKIEEACVAAYVSTSPRTESTGSTKP